MTVCVGALCCDSDNNPNRAIVVASDRMVTMGGLIEFEHEVPKVTSITNKVVALVAGDALKASQIVRSIAARYGNSDASVGEIVEQTTTIYSTLRLRQIENDIFKPRGLQLAEFYRGLQQSILPPIVGQLDAHMQNFDFGFELLIAGIDTQGAHLFSVSNPGTYQDYLPIGFTAIGSGTLHAIQTLISFGHSGNKSLQETIFNVYVAKKRAEVAPGVGKDTDLLVITDRGTKRADSEILSQLETIYTDYQKPVSSELKDEVARLNFYAEGNENVE